MAGLRGKQAPWTEEEDALLLKAVTAYDAAPPPWWVAQKMPHRTQAAIEQRVSRVIKSRVVRVSGPDRRTDNTGLDDGPPLYGRGGVLTLYAKEMFLCHETGVDTAILTVPRGQR